jgi:hypothetical protein
MVIWHLKGRTSCLGVADSARIPWQETKKIDSNGQLMSTLSLTKAAKDFRSFDKAWLFTQIDSPTPKIFGDNGEGFLNDSWVTFSRAAHPKLNPEPEGTLTARNVECRNNLQQLRMVIQMASSGHLPQTLEEVKQSNSGVEIVCPFSGEPYQYDASTGRVSCLHSGHEKF